MKFENNFSKHLVALLMLIPLFVFSQKEYFPTNSGVKVVNEPYKAFVNATIVVNSEKTIENGTIIFRDGKIINVGKGIKMPKNTIIIDKKDKLRMRLKKNRTNMVKLEEVINRFEDKSEVKMYLKNPYLKRLRLRKVVPITEDSQLTDSQQKILLNLKKRKLSGENIDEIAEEMNLKNLL